MCYSGKKILIIGGSFQHIKVVEAAKRLGVETYVVDYLDKARSPAKQVADYDYKVDIFDIEKIVGICKKNNIDGVLSCNLDVCQKPYVRVCDRLGFPCFGNIEQFERLTDKQLFKELCKKNGIDTIAEYSKACVLKECFEEYPVFIKPAESNASYGQTICYERKTLENALDYAKKVSRNGKVLIEKYMEGYPDFAVQGIVLNGQFHVTRTGDRFLGTKELNKSEIFGLYPSMYSELYFNNVHSKIEKMLNEIGCDNCPVFLQGFVDGDTIRFYDPGLRFSGMEYELIYKRLFGIDLSEEFVRFALSGKFTAELGEQIDLSKTDKFGALMYVPLHSGTIGKIVGEEIVASHKDIVTIKKQYFEGDYVGDFNNAKQRLAEIDMICDSIDELQQLIKWIYGTLKILDDKGQDMFNHDFDVNRLNDYKKER